MIEISILEIFSWVGALCLATCSIPQVWQCYKQGNAKGVNLPFLLMWLLGCGSMTVYSIGVLLPPALIANYAMSLAFVLIILRYKIRPRAVDKKVG